MTELLINICSSGCKIVIDDSWPKSTIHKILSHLPKNMICVDMVKKKHRRTRILSIKKISLNDNIENNLQFYFKYDHKFGIHLWTGIDINISMSVLPHSSKYLQNQISINKIVHYLYTERLEEPISTQLDSYKKKLWGFMYDECFGTKGILYLLICDKYLISDITKSVIGNILIIEKWNNLGFGCI